MSGVFGSLAAYFTSTLSAKWRRRSMAPALIATTVPAIAMLIPFFQAFNALGTLNSPAALGVLYGLLCLPTTVLILHAFFVDFPNDVREASAISAACSIGLDRGRNLQIDVRGSRAMSSARKNAADFAALVPDVILGAGNSSIGPLLQATRSVPIVFVTAADPVGAGFVNSLARPGGNATGFLAFDYTISAKWWSFLKKPPEPGACWGPSESGNTCCDRPVCRHPGGAPSLGVEASALNVHDTARSRASSQPSRAARMAA